MNTKLYKCIIAFALSFMALPMMAQDYLKLYFKDGHTERHFMHLVQNISATKYDLEGNLHSDYQMQQIVMVDTTYSYYIADIDSMVFRKIDEEQIKTNVETLQASLESITQRCSNIEELSSHINEIKGIDGVENVYCDGEDFVIQIRDWIDIVISHQPMPEVVVPFYGSSTSNKIRRAVPTAKDGSPYKVTIGCQMDTDENFALAKEYIENLRDDFSSMGYDPKYYLGAELNFDFYFKNMFDSNILLIDTHGGYGFFNKKHYLYTGIEANHAWSSWVGKQMLNKLGVTIDNIDLDDISITCCEHSDGNVLGVKWFWMVKEDFIRKSPYSFTGSGPHIVFISACSSLEGNGTLIRSDEQKVNGSDSFAQVFFNKGADACLGYNRGSVRAPYAASCFFDHMLHGASLQRAFNELLPYYKHENRKTDDNAYLVDLYNENSDNPKGIFIVNTHTVEKTNQECQTEFNNFGKVALNGETSINATNHSADHYAEEMDFGTYYGYLNFGFKIASQPNIDELSNSEIITSNNADFINDRTGEVVFSASFTPKLDNIYYYRAFTYDGIHYNWGEEKSFTITPLRVSTGTLSLEAGWTQTVDILSGNGDYEIESSDESVATASVNDNTISVNALKAGDAEITITDKSGQTTTIKVTVTAKDAGLALSATNLVTLKVDEGRTIVIASGSGDYSVECSREVVAKVNKRGRYIDITGLREGRATITVTDDESGQRKSFDVKVKARISSSVVSLINNGNMECIDVSSFFAKTGAWDNDYFPAEIIDGVGVDGSHGIEVDATDMVSEIWDNQFWIRFDQPVSAGTNYRIYFDYRADNDATVRVEEHGEPGDYIEWERAYIDFTPDWNTYSKYDVVASNQSLDEKPFQSLAFDLSMYEYANNYYFDNVKFEVYLEDQCPKPTFTVAENVVSIESPFNATIYYTLDGTTPTTSSSVYSSSIILESAKSWTIKAIAVVDGYEASPVATYYYTGGSQ